MEIPDSDFEPWGRFEGSDVKWSFVGAGGMWFEGSQMLDVALPETEGLEAEKDGVDIFAIRIVLYST